MKLKKINFWEMIERIVSMWKLSGILLIGIITVVGAIIDFQNIKASVRDHETKIGVVAVIVCQQAINQKMDNADSICSDIIKSK